MSQGKYSPKLPHCNNDVFIYNAYGKVPTPITNDAPYDTLTMFGSFDDEGFDAYGYSCFDRNGKYVGLGAGIDRLGYTESEYLNMDADEFQAIVDNAYLI